MTTRTLASAPRYTRNSTTKGGPVGMILTALAIWSERQKLKRLDEARLRDIGVTRHDAMTEASRAVWDAPARWFL